MNQTAYRGISNLTKKHNYTGGFCRFWFIPKEEIESFALVNPLNQYLGADITLKEGKAWRGPVQVPDKQLAFTESMEVSKAGPFYKLKVAAFYPGDTPATRINLDNMAYHQFVIVGKLRSGGFYVVIGNIETAANFDQEYESGSGNGNAAMNKISFTHEQIFKALVLPAFGGDISGGLGAAPPEGSSYTTNETEIIDINDESSKTILYTAARKKRFGEFPEVECWLTDETDTYFLAAVQPTIDAPPPGFTQMNWDFGSNVTGFIVLK